MDSAMFEADFTYGEFAVVVMVRYLVANKVDARHQAAALVPHGQHDAKNDKGDIWIYPGPRRLEVKRIRKWGDYQTYPYIGVMLDKPAVMNRSPPLAGFIIVNDPMTWALLIPVEGQDKWYPRKEGTGDKRPGQFDEPRMMIKRSDTARAVAIDPAHRSEDNGTIKHDEG